MKKIYKENLVKNVLLIIGLTLLRSPVQSYIMSGDLLTHKDDAGNTYSITGSIYFTPNIGIAAGYQIFKAEDTDTTTDADSIMVAVTGRI